jgi:hypothetical protein
MNDAVRSLEASLHKNEDWLLGALLGTNEDGNLFRDENHRDNWRGRDYLDNFMTEKDIQTTLASHLTQIGEWCHVHVEVPV